MQPNAITNAQASQVTQLQAFKASCQAKLDTTNKAMEHLKKCCTDIDNIGKVPSFADVHKLASAIRNLAMAQLVSAELNVINLQAEVDMVDSAIKTTESPILQAHRL